MVHAKSKSSSPIFLPTTSWPTPSQTYQLAFVYSQCSLLFFIRPSMLFIKFDRLEVNGNWAKFDIVFSSKCTQLYDVAAVLSAIADPLHELINMKLFMMRYSPMSIFPCWQSFWMKHLERRRLGCSASPFTVTSQVHLVNPYAGKGDKLTPARL